MYLRAWLNLAAGWSLVLALSSAGWPQQARDSAAPAENARQVAPRGLPGFLRRHQHRTEPRGFGLLADDDQETGDNVAPRPNVRAANASATARARQFLALGDDRFQSQQFSLAYQRYKKAAQAAPDLAEAYLRRGLAQVALGHYAQAAASIKLALALEPRWATSTFRLDEVYGDNQFAKRIHWERLADAAIEEPDNADLLLLVGIELHFDGQSERARPFFQRAADLGEDPGLWKGFFADPPAAGGHRGEDL